MLELSIFASATEIEIAVRPPWRPTVGDAWLHVAVTFLDVALGGRGVWIATTAEPANLDWAEILSGSTNGSKPYDRTCDGRNVECGYVERFDERFGRAVVGSSDFQWDSGFLFPGTFAELNCVIAALENVDVRTDPLVGTSELVHSFGDGMGVRWIHPPQTRDIERVEKVCIENGVTLVAITADDRS